MWIAIALLALTLLVVLYLVYLMDQKTRQLSNDLAKLSDDLAKAREGNQVLRERMISLEQDAESAARREWLQAIPNSIYRNEIEVEAKFVYPLVKFLGYADSQISVRVPTSFALGTKTQKGEADWVLWQRGSSANDRMAAVVIEAKEPNQALNEVVQRQARSYAFSLGAPRYAITNGQEIQIYELGIRSDTCLLRCSVGSLSSQWQATFDAIGAKQSFHAAIAMLPRTMELPGRSVPPVTQ